MFATIFEIVMVSMVLVGIVKEEKLVEFEDRMLDSAAKQVAGVINRRRAKQLEQQREIRAQQNAQARREKMHIVKEQPARRSSIDLYIA